MRRLRLVEQFDDHDRPLDDRMSDEDLIGQLAAGHDGAIALIHHRHAARIYRLAAQTLDASTADEITQDVFLTVWRKAATFDPTIGPFRPWLIRIARTRILNELRRRSRRPRADADNRQLSDVAGREPNPEEAALRASRHEAIRSAVAALPRPQRQAVQLAFLDGLTHEQIASLLATPLGTTKTRVRAGLRSLRTHPAIMGLAGTFLVLAITAGTALFSSRAGRDDNRRSDRALHVLAASDTTVRRLDPVGTIRPIPDPFAAMHATYRSRRGATTAVMTFSHFVKAPPGSHYVAWVRYGPTWRALHDISINDAGTALVIIEGRDLDTDPDALVTTLETDRRGAGPSTRVVVAWPPR